MKIALCLEYPLAQLGGVEVLVTELVFGLAARHQVVLVSPDDAASLARSPVAPLLTGHIPWQTEPATTARGRELAGKLKAAGVDIVHFHFGGNYNWKNRAFNKCPVVAVARAGIPCLSTNHGAFSIMEGFCSRFRPLPVKLALFGPAWLSKQYVVAHLAAEVAVSQNDYRNLRRWYPPVANKFRWIYHSRIRETVPPPFNPDRTKTILCAGTIGMRKGQWYLVEAFKLLAAKFPDWRVVLVGRTDDAEVGAQVREMITREKLADRITMPGPCSDAELREHLRTAGVFAMPSIWEGLGLSLQEAQFYGCPCVGTRCGGVPDLIQDGDNGLLVPVRDPVALAAALEKLLGDAALRERLSRRAPQSVLEKRMTAPQMVTAYEELYAEMVTGKRG